MRSRDDFDAFIAEELEPRLALEREKVAALRALRASRRLPGRYKVASIAAGLCLSLVAGSFAPLMLGVVLPFAVDLFRMSQVKGPKIMDVRTELIRSVVEFWGPEFEYHPWRGVDEAELAACRLVPERYDRLSSGDTVIGKYNATSFRFSELRLFDVQKDAPDRLLWSGIYLVADFNKSFDGRIFVLPDKTERLLGSLVGRALQSLPFRGEGRLIELENPRFEQHFKVYAESDQEARYVLSPSLLRRIVEFKESMDVEVRMAFIDDRVHVVLPVAADFFQAPAIEQVTPAVIRSWADELHYVTGILDELDLNTRIWSKRAGREPI